jgi:pyridoxine 5-phosphate synthase
MTRLSVNVNKVALLRNSRGGNTPDVVAFARTCEQLGADGITVHPRPDGRHIRIADVYALRDALGVELNVEGYPTPAFLELVERVRPAQVTLVPDPPDALTSDHGWDIPTHQVMLREVIERLKAIPTRVSLFIDPVPTQVEAAKEVGADAVELYTGPYAKNYLISPGQAVRPYEAAAQRAADIGLRLHAGHDLNLENLRFLRQHLPNLAEVSIGHALITDALYLGIAETLRRYRQALTP